MTHRELLAAWLLSNPGPMTGYSSGLVLVAAWRAFRVACDVDSMGFEDFTNALHAEGIRPGKTDIGWSLPLPGKADNFNRLT